MVENSVNKVPKGPKVLGVLSMVFSGLGIIGMVMIMIAAALPSGRSVQIESVEARTCWRLAWNNLYDRYAG